MAVISLNVFSLPTLRLYFQRAEGVLEHGNYVLILRPVCCLFAGQNAVERQEP